MDKTNHEALHEAQAAAQAPIPNAMMDTRGAAEYLKLKPAALIDYRTKRLPPVYVKLHGAVRYLRSDLDAWIQSCRRCG